jgi:hypothetical protein
VGAIGCQATCPDDRQAVLFDDESAVFMSRTARSRAARALQRMGRIEADIRNDRPLRDGRELLTALENWSHGISIDTALGLTAAARRLAARRVDALAALELSGISNCTTGHLGWPRAVKCRAKIDEYLKTDGWKANRQNQPRPAGLDGACWVLVINNHGRPPSIDKLRKIRTDVIEAALVKLSPVSPNDFVSEPD